MTTLEIVLADPTHARALAGIMDSWAITDGAAIELPPVSPRDRAAAHRFVNDLNRRSCSFVNLSGNAIEALTKTAQENSLVLTSCEEENVGLVTRLTRGSPGAKEAADESVFAATFEDEAVEKVPCTRCALAPGKQRGGKAAGTAQAR